jgi:ATP-dependent Clp protease ATP-binding subunit ClpC
MAITQPIGTPPDPRYNHPCATHPEHRSKLTMFERYTEKARRVIFFARYEASQFGSPYIETEHMLLGILREDKAITNRFLRSHASVASIRSQIEKATTVREKVSTSVDLPLSDECKHILSHAADEAEKLGDKHIGTEHLVLGILREENCFAAELLKERGIQAASVREAFATSKTEILPQVSPPMAPSDPGLFRDLTQAAVEGSLEPVVGRGLELAAVIEVLCGSRRNPVLLGPRGAGKTTIVQGLAQQIADGAVPLRLAQKRLIEVDPLLLTGWTSDRRRFDEFAKLLGSLATPHQTILFIDLFQKPSESRARAGIPDFIAFLKWLLSHLGLQYIAVADPQEFTEAAQANPWLLDIFREIHVRPLDEQSTLLVLRARKTSLENFHGVAYSNPALEAALQSAASNPSRGSLLQTALDLLDAAGTLIALRPISPAIAEAQKKIRHIVERMESAIQNHEFEKARFYSDEEKKERENLRNLRQSEGITSLVDEVTPDDIRQVLARWSAYPYAQ